MNFYVDALEDLTKKYIHFTSVEFFLEYWWQCILIALIIFILLVFNKLHKRNP